VLFLQKSSDARRVYATILNSATNNDGNKIVGITHPSAEIQANLLNICYEKLNISPNDVDYFEAHATSTETGDIVELHSIDDFFCGQRTSPLKVGSVKGNTGHTEGASGTVSILKSILVFENGKLFPNINIDELRDDCPGLTEGRLQVVREVEQFDGKIIGINNFGVMGTNAHCVLKRNEKVKENGGFPYDNLPRLLLWSGRTEEGVNLIFDDILSRPFDDEYLSLLQYSQSESMNGMNVKGFSIYKIHQETRSFSCFDRRVKILEKTNPPVVFVYAGMGSQWLEMGRDLMKIPLIAESIQKCHDVLAKHGFDLKNILTSNSSNNFDHCVNIFVGIASIQIALTDLVCSIGIKPDYYIGHSFGELGCSYIDKTLSLEETILTAYCRGLAAIEGVKTSGKMAAVAMKYEELEKILPNDIEIACHNSIESCTISGPVESVEKFVKEIKSEHVLAKIVETCGIGFHSSMIADCGPILAEKLKDVIKNPKIRSSKWITTSEVDENDGYSSIQYHVNNMIGKVHFAEGMAKIPENAVMIEIAPHGLLQPILKQSVPNGITESLTKRDTQDGVIYLLQALGRIYQSGVDMNIREIYPKINFPVSRSTPMISPLIKWKHEIDFSVPMYNPMTLKLF
jgi:fatty acid synthase, animal type